METNWRPIEVAIALSLYGYNVSPGERAEAIYSYFGGQCAEPEDLLRIMETPRLAFAATELAPPSAKIYVEEALMRYGLEARERCNANGI